MTRMAQCLILFLLVAQPLVAETATDTAGQLLVRQVHGESLEGSITGEDTERTVAVYLPPSYGESPSRRYPVLFLLHGIGGTEGDWAPGRNSPAAQWRTLEGLMNAGVVAGRLHEMIVVMPDQMTKGGGSFYTNSSVTGRWEDFTVRDLVAWVDGTFRTLARAESRGIAGHSMGGYGAIMLGMKHPSVFGAVYAMSPAVMNWGAEIGTDNPAFRAVVQRQGWGELQGFMERGLVCVAQAFSPAPLNAPFFVDFPFSLVDGQLVPSDKAHAAWEEHFPILLAPRYRENLLRLRGIRFDAGIEDEFAHIPMQSKQLSHVLTELGVPHVFEEYNGDHRNRLWGRMGRLNTELLPWFSLLLERDNRSRFASTGGRNGAK